MLGGREERWRWCQPCFVSFRETKYLQNRVTSKTPWRAQHCSLVPIWPAEEKILIHLTRKCFEPQGSCESAGQVRVALRELQFPAWFLAWGCFLRVLTMYLSAAFSTSVSWRCIFSCQLTNPWTSADALDVLQQCSVFVPPLSIFAVPIISLFLCCWFFSSSLNWYFKPPGIYSSSLFLSLSWMQRWPDIVIRLCQCKCKL